MPKSVSANIGNPTSDTPLLVLLNLEYDYIIIYDTLSIFNTCVVKFRI